MVKGLQYLTFSRPDLSYAIHQLCQFMQFPTDQHLAAGKRVLRYVRGTLTTSLKFNLGPLALSAFTDADWARDLSDHRSTMGYLVFLGSSPIS